MLDRLFAHPTPMGQRSVQAPGEPPRYETSAWSHGTRLDANVTTQALFDRVARGAEPIEPAVSQAIVDADAWSFVLLFPLRSIALLSEVVLAGLDGAGAAWTLERS